jgi:hypothetical protein
MMTSSQRRSQPRHSSTPFVERELQAGTVLVVPGSESDILEAPAERHAVGTFGLDDGIAVAVLMRVPAIPLSGVAVLSHSAVGPIHDPSSRLRQLVERNIYSGMVAQAFIIAPGVRPLTRDGNGRYDLILRTPEPVRHWTAFLRRPPLHIHQVSLHLYSEQRDPDRPDAGTVLVEFPGGNQPPVVRVEGVEVQTHRS